MSSLPPVVIRNPKNTKLMLTPLGWSSIRRHACSFDTPEQALEWERAERKVTPALFPAAACLITASPHVEDERQGLTGGLVSDYDHLGAL